MEQFKFALARDDLQIGDRLPTVRQLAVDLSINPNTVVRAYRELEFAGMIETHQGFAPLNALLLVIIFVPGFLVHRSRNTFSIEAVLMFLGSALCLAFLIRLTQVWEAVVILGTADCQAGYLHLAPPRRPRHSRPDPQADRSTGSQAPFWLIVGLIR